MILHFNQLEQALGSAGSILFVSHKNPDPDTIGSALALGAYAESLGKKTGYFCLNELLENFSFLGGAQKFSADKELFNGFFDLVIFVDCSELARCGIPNIAEYKKQPWIVIDHHIDRGAEADLVIRDSAAAANCEIIYKFLLHAGFFIDNTVATALLAGILIDTNFLSNSATATKTIEMAGELSRAGADYRSVLKWFYFNKDKKILKVWGAALSRLKYNKEKEMSSTVIFKDDIGNDRNLDEAMEGFANFLNAILKSNIILVLKEYDGEVRGNLRTSEHNIDVSKIAEGYGGGGHRKAAGFMCQGKIVERENEWTVEKE